MSDKELVHRELAGQIIGAFYDVHRELGAGFLESVYQRAMVIALAHRGVRSRTEVPVRVRFRGAVVGTYRIDLLVDDAVIVECKTADRIVAAHKVQLLNYLQATHYRLGIVLCFGPAPTFQRIVHDRARSSAESADVEARADGN